MGEDSESSNLLIRFRFYIGSVALWKFTDIVYKKIAYIYAATWSMF